MSSFLRRLHLSCPLLLRTWMWSIPISSGTMPNCSPTSPPPTSPSSPWTEWSFRFTVVFCQRDRRSLQGCWATRCKRTHRAGVWWRMSARPPWRHCWSSSIRAPWSGLPRRRRRSLPRRTSTFSRIWRRPAALSWWPALKWPMRPLSWNWLTCTTHRTSRRWPWISWRTETPRNSWRLAAWRSSPSLETEICLERCSCSVMQNEPIWIKHKNWPFPCTQTVFLPLFLPLSILFILYSPIMIYHKTWAKTAFHCLLFFLSNQFDAGDFYRPILFSLEMGRLCTSGLKYPDLFSVVSLFEFSGVTLLVECDFAFCKWSSVDKIFAFPQCTLYTGVDWSVHRSIDWLIDWHNFNRYGFFPCRWRHMSVFCFCQLDSRHLLPCFNNKSEDFEDPGKVSKTLSSKEINVTHTFKQEEAGKQDDVNVCTIHKPHIWFYMQMFYLREARTIRVPTCDAKITIVKWHLRRKNPFRIFFLLFNFKIVRGKGRNLVTRWKW